MTLTGDHKKMSVGDANVKTANKVNAVSRINRNEHGRQSLHTCSDWRPCSFRLMRLLWSRV